MSEADLKQIIKSLVAENDELRKSIRDGETTIAMLWNTAIKMALCAIEGVNSYDEMDPAASYKEAVDRLRVRL